MKSDNLMTKWSYVTFFKCFLLFIQLFIFLQGKFKTTQDFENLQKIKYVYGNQDFKIIFRHLSESFKLLIIDFLKMFDCVNYL